MSKLFYILAIFMMASSINVFAEDEPACPEGKVFDADFEACIDAPAEEPAEEGSEE